MSVICDSFSISFCTYSAPSSLTSFVLFRGSILLLWLAPCHHSDIYLFGCPGFSCCMWDLVPWPGIKRKPQAPSPLHWEHRVLASGPPGKLTLYCLLMTFPCGSAGKEFTCNAGDLGSIPGLGRSPGEGKAFALQYSSLENSIDCIVHGVAKVWHDLATKLLQKF